MHGWNTYATVDITTDSIFQITTITVTYKMSIFIFFFHKVQT